MPAQFSGGGEAVPQLEGRGSRPTTDHKKEAFFYIALLQYIYSEHIML